MHDGKKSQCGNNGCIIIITYKKHDRIRRLGGKPPPPKDPQAQKRILRDSFHWQHKYVISLYVPSGYAAVHLYMSFICTVKTKLSTCRLVDLSTCGPMRWGKCSLLMVISVRICRLTVTYQTSLLAKRWLLYCPQQ